MGTQFRLVRYFSITSLVAIAIVTVFLGMFYRRIALNDLTELAESRNIALTQAFANFLWPQFAPFVASASGLSVDELRVHPEIAKLRQAVLAQMRGLEVVKVKVYNIAGLTVFSTEAKQIGEDKSNNAGFLSARSGKVASELTHRDTFSAFEQIIKDRDVFSSYIPIRSAGPAGPIQGVFELYYDVTPFLQKVGRTRRLVVIGLMLIFAFLYGVLFVIVRRADGVIRRQGNELKQYLEEIKKANETLEQRVQKRTQELFKVNEKLETEITERKQAEGELELINQRLERSLGELGSLYAALTPVDLSGSINQMMERVIERLIEATGADAALIRLHNKETGAFICASQRGFPAYYLERALTLPPGSALDYVFSSDDPIISADIAADPRLKGKIQLEVGLHSCAFLPLKVGREMRGIVHLASREMGYFREEKKEHLMAIARQMGIAIENRELFDEISAARDELEKANKVKDEFLGFVSHELRTPVNAVIGYAAMLQDGLFGGMTEEQKETLGKIAGRSHELLSMINTLLEATRIEAGAVKVEKDEVMLGGFLRELRSTYDVRLDKELTLIWDYPLDLPTLETDRDKLRHILQNLINNAIKYTDKGSVTISARIIEGSRTSASSVEPQKAESSQQEGKGLPTANCLLPTEQGYVEFRVTDTGIGILKESIPSVFEMFRQVKGSKNGSRGGVGLGLHIVKKFVELLGGEIAVESAPGKGSTFMVTIPC